MRERPKAEEKEGIAWKHAENEETCDNDAKVTRIAFEGRRWELLSRCKGNF